MTHARPDGYQLIDGRLVLDQAGYYTATLVAVEDREPSKLTGAHYFTATFKLDEPGQGLTISSNVPCGPPGHYQANGKPRGLRAADFARALDPSRAQKIAKRVLDESSISAADIRPLIGLRCALQIENINTPSDKILAVVQGHETLAFFEDKKARGLHRWSPRVPKPAGADLLREIDERGPTHTAGHLIRSSLQSESETIRGLARRAHSIEAALTGLQNSGGLSMKAMSDFAVVSQAHDYSGVAQMWTIDAQDQRSALLLQFHVVMSDLVCAVNEAERRRAIEAAKEVQS